MRERLEFADSACTDFDDDDVKFHLNDMSGAIKWRSQE